MSYVVEKRVVLQRGSLARGTEPVLGWKRCPLYPNPFPTRTAAKVAVMVDLEPQLRGAPPKFVEMHFAAMARNLGWFRVVSIPS